MWRGFTSFLKVSFLKEKISIISFVKSYLNDQSNSKSCRQTFNICITFKCIILFYWFPYNIYNLVIRSIIRELWNRLPTWILDWNFRWRNYRSYNLFSFEVRGRGIKFTLYICMIELLIDKVLCNSRSIAVIYNENNLQSYWVQAAVIFLEKNFKIVNKKTFIFRKLFQWYYNLLRNIYNKLLKYNKILSGKYIKSNKV